jgi:molybdopterin/thiamine biosynthesis adenylyltransferase
MNELRIGETDYRRLSEHLFPGDRDEHGALLLAGEYRRADGGSLLTVRELHLLDDEEFPPGRHGYRQLAAAALARVGNRAAEEGLALISAHSHPGSGERTGLSHDDLAAHERIFEHLLDITAARVVAGVAFGEHSAAGELWRSDGERAPIGQVRVVGSNIDLIRAAPIGSGPAAQERFDRQVRLFGEAGQDRLRALNVAVIGAGGGGSILAEQLAHLGVGGLTVVDPDIVKRHNLSRIIGASEQDARRETKKVHVAARNIRQIDPMIVVHAIDGDIADLDVARQLLACDYMFLATDTVIARLLANALAQSFLIPLVQIGAKVDTNTAGEIEHIYTAVRPVLPRRGCLFCAGLIDPETLQREAASPEEHENQNYLGEAEIIDPSVTTLNAAAAAGALNVFLMATIGQASDMLAEHRITLTREGTTLEPQVPARPECRWCGEHAASRFARADLSLLPCRPAPAHAAPVQSRQFRLRDRLRRLRVTMR